MRIEIDANKLNSTELIILTEWLRRGIAVEISMWESIPPAKPKVVPTPRPMPEVQSMECAEKKPRYLKVDVTQKVLDIGPKKKQHRESKLADVVDKMAEYMVARPNKVYTMPKLMNRFKIARGNWSKLKRRLSRKHNVDMIRDGHQWLIAAKGCPKLVRKEPKVKEEAPKLAEHEKPMSQKSEFLKFRSERIKHHMKHDGVGYMEACRMVNAEWKPKKQQKVGEVRIQFPQLTSVKMEFLPILRDILSNLMHNPGSKMDYNSVAYTLSIKNTEQYNELVQEILMKAEDIKTYFGIDSGRFVFSNSELCWK